MLEWSIITDLLNLTYMQGLLINSSYDAIKGIWRRTQKDSFQNQLYSVINDTFQQFYEYYNLVYEPECILPFYFEKVGHEDVDSKEVLKTALNYATGLKITEIHLNKWIKIFEENVSNPKYQWVYNWLCINTKVPVIDNSWMSEWMAGNVCRVHNKFDLTDKSSLLSSAHQELTKLFNSVSTELSFECWRNTRNLIYEMVTNVHYHGHANESYIEIQSDNITIVDDGNEFEPRLLLKTDLGRIQGGKITFKQFIRNYPEIELSYYRKAGYNFFCINFKANVININKMSRLNIDTKGDYLELKTRRDAIGNFKYYYLDMEQLIPEEQHFLGWLPISLVANEMKSLAVNVPVYNHKSIVFIYFSELCVKRFGDLHDSFYLIAKDFNEKRKDVEIKVIPERNIYWTGAE